MASKLEKGQERCGEFARYASFCEAFAATAEEPIEKAALLEMAERWRELAKETDVRARWMFE
jgi:hypothetical protein